MDSSRDHTPRHRVRHINPVRAHLLQVFGPADSWDSPLVGTKYDPVIRQHRQHEQQVAKEARKAKRERQHERHRADAEPETDHHTPDEV
jgi:hypothetical protein